MYVSYNMMKSIVSYDMELKYIVLYVSDDKKYILSVG